MITKHFCPFLFSSSNLAVNEDNCNVAGYTAWCLLDTFEWSSGYHEKFGLYYIDFEDPRRPRTPKKSAGALAKIYRLRGFPSEQHVSQIYLQTNLICGSGHLNRRKETNLVCHTIW